MKQRPLKKKPFLKFLTVQELEKLNTKRLLGVLNSVRAVEGNEQFTKRSTYVCCDLCDDWILGKEAFDEYVIKPTAHLTAYKERIKKILATREHVS